MSDILIGVIVFGLVFGAAIFGMFLGRNLRAYSGLRRIDSTSAAVGCRAGRIGQERNGLA
jgi:hypothetical protein